MPWVQEFNEGDRVTVWQGREEYTGTVLTEAVGVDFTHYFVMLDEGGEGWWSENEMSRTALRATAAHEAEVQRRLAAEDYPELVGALETRPNLVAEMDEAEYMASLTRTALYLPLREEAPGRTSGYAEGFEQGKEGTTQMPSSHDPAYMGEYLLGWAQGVKTRNPQPEPRYTHDLHEDEPNLPPMHFDPDMGGPGPGEHGWLHNASLAKDAGIMDFLTGSPEPSETWAGPGRNWSYDWCRFRRESHCWLPRSLNREASEEVGYAVWVPEDRGHCKRVSWEAQEACPLSQPGPNVPGGFTDATIPWDQGGQRGVPTQKIAAAEDEFAWHYTAAWKDVRNKASEIKRAGRVRVLAVNMQDDGLHPDTFYGQVGSTTGTVYNTGLTFVPGSWKVAAWECDCKWAQYAWGRTRQWIKYEGRMCAHALALVFEMQSRGLKGMPDDEDEIAPDWVPKESVKGKVTREDYPVVQAMLDTGAPVSVIQAALGRFGVEFERVAVKGRLRGKINGVVQDLEFADGEVLYHGVPYTGEVQYPEYHPTLGLDVTY